MRMRYLAIGLGLLGAFTGCSAKEPSGGKLAAAGDVIVSVHRARIGKNTDGAEGAPKDAPCLGVIVTIENTSTTRKIDYEPWSSVPREKMNSAQDDLGNTYRPLFIPPAVFGSKPVARTIYPGETIRDMLGFEAPVEAAAWVAFELDAGNVGQSGTINLAVPTVEIDREL